MPPRSGSRQVRWFAALLPLSVSASAHVALVGMLAAAGRHGQAQRCYAAYVARMGEIDVAVAPFPSS